MLKVNQLDGFGAENKRAVLQYISSNKASGSTVTFTNQDIGLAYQGRYVLVAIAGSTSGRTFSSVTIGGITATQHAVAASYPVAIYGAYIPTGTTATIIVTLSGGDDVGIAVYNAYNLKSSTAYNSATTTTGSGTTVSVNLNIALGFYIAVVINTNNGSTTYTWSGITEDVSFPTTATARNMSAASSPSYAEETARTITATHSISGATKILVAASFT